MKSKSLFWFMAGILLLCLCISSVSAAEPVAAFSGTPPLSGESSLTVAFTDESTGSPSGWAWYFGDETYAGAWTGFFPYVGFTPVTGDWNGDGIASAGNFKDGIFSLDWDSNWLWNGPVTDRQYTSYFPYNSGDMPVSGDWNNDGRSEIGVYVPSAHSFYLDSNGDGVWNPSGDIQYEFGIAGDIPVSGDWNGDGTTEIGVFRNGDTWYLDYNGDGMWGSEPVDRQYTFGTTGDMPVTGDWNNDVNHNTEIGVYSPSTEQFYLDWNGNGVWDVGTDQTFTFSSGGIYPVSWGGFPTKVGTFKDGIFALDTDGDHVWENNDWAVNFATTGWSGRESHSSVALPDGDIVLMGGNSRGGGYMNDVWLSTDDGATWTQQKPDDATGWSGREKQSSVALPNGHIVLMGGWASACKNDVWLSTDKGVTWTQKTASAEWSARYDHSSVALPNGHIVLMGGYENGAPYHNDVWILTDEDASWTQLPDAPWSARRGQSSVVMPDGDIVLMGGSAIDGVKNDVWLSTNEGASWTQQKQNDANGWSARYDHSSVALPDGSIVLMGGSYQHDVWRSTDKGVTWTLVTTDPGWTERTSQSSVAMPDGNIVLTGGFDNSYPWGIYNFMGDTWLLQPTAGSTIQNPSHTYTTPGIYQVALQVYNADGYSSIRKPGYITVTAPATPITTCPYVISSPGVYELQNDCTNSGHELVWYGITIQSSDVVFDGMGHTIDGLIQGVPGVKGVYAYTGSPLSNIFVRNVTVNGTYNGIYYYHVNNGRIDNITARNNGESGIMLLTSSGNTVTNSTVTDTTDTGFGLWIGSNSNTLLNNTATDNDRGFGIFQGQNNIVADNIFENNRFGVELMTPATTTNTIKRNIIRRNSEFGMLIASSYGNSIYDNYFSNTANINILGPGGSEIWNTALNPGINIIGGSLLGGNYWADPSGTGYSQTCQDTTPKNGICDFAYPITTGNFDNFPLTSHMKPKDVVLYMETNYDLSKKVMQVSPYVLTRGSRVQTIGIHSTLTMPDYPGHVAFIDEDPEANWDHNATIVYVEDTENIPQTAEYHVSSQLADVDLSYGAGVTPPDPNGEPGIVTFQANAQGDTGGSINSFAACTPECNHYYALLLSGGIRKEANYARYRNDISKMFITLNKTYGYPKSHITVLMSDGTDPTEDQLTGYDINNKPLYANSDPDLDGSPASVDVKSVPATRTNVLATLADLRDTLGTEDNLFIFTTNHGANMHTGEATDLFTKDVVLYLWGTGDEGWITDADFVNALPGSPSHSEKGIKSISMVMEQCFGGGFIDNFIDTPGWSTQTRVIATAADWYEYSWGNAFSFQWINGVTGTRFPMNEAFNFAKANDRYFNDYTPSKENPQFFPLGSGTDQYLADCSATPSLTITEPQAWTWYTGQKHSIKWTQAALEGTPVNIELWKNTFPGTKVMQIAALTLDNQPTGEYIWDPIPTNLAAGSYYWIKINRTDIPDTFWRSEGFLTINKARGIATGKLWVNTTPIPTAGNADGARFGIKIDGVFVPQKTNSAWNLTNSSVILPSGTYYVAVGGLGGPEDLTHYGVPLTRVDVPQGTISLNLPLQPIINDCPPFGVMDISSEPNAKATVRDQNTQKIYGVYTIDTIGTQIQIAPGTYTVTAEADGYKTATQTNVVIIPSVVNPPCNQPGNERPTFVKFNLEQISEVPVPAIVKIVPRSLNLASNGYFMAFVTLPSGHKAADVIPGSVVCEGATALKLVRHKLFPKTFVAIFRRSDLWDIPTGNSVPMTVTGSILQTTGNPVFSGSDSIKVIRTKVTKEDTDDWGKMTDEKIFSQFNPGYTKDDEKVFSQFNQKDNKNNENGQSNQRDDKNNGKDNGKSR